MKSKKLMQLLCCILLLSTHYVHSPVSLFGKTPRPSLEKTIRKELFYTSVFMVLGTCYYAMKKYQEQKLSHAPSEISSKKNLNVLDETKDQTVPDKQNSPENIGFWEKYKDNSFKNKAMLLIAAIQKNKDAGIYNKWKQEEWKKNRDVCIDYCKKHDKISDFIQMTDDRLAWKIPNVPSNIELNVNNNKYSIGVKNADPSEGLKALIQYDPVSITVS